MDIETVLKVTRIPSRSALARVCGVSKQAVSRWRILPEANCPPVEAYTGVKCELLRPDVNWIRQRGKIIGYTVPVVTSEAA